jgi:CheY-like chemotaxis protein
MAQIRRTNRDAALTPVIGAADQAFDALSDLLDAVLEVSKLMLGRVRPEWRHIELAPLFSRLDAQLRPFAEQKGLRMQVDCPAQTYARADALLLERVLRNLCLNAIKFTRSGHVTLRARVRAGRVDLVVADTGIGIAAADLARVFEPFVQLGNPARQREQGLGLGLAIVRDLCALMELPLRLRSQPGRGSLFRLSCLAPDARTVQRLQAQARAAPDLVAGSLVVLIDDDPLSLEATAFSLGDMGCQVLPATSSEAALQALAAREDLPHAIVSDFRLDGESGLDAIARLRGALAERFGDEFEIPALLISGDTQPEEVQRIGDAGLRLLSKPIRPEALHAELNELFDRLLHPAAHETGA